MTRVETVTEKDKRCCHGKWIFPKLYPYKRRQHSRVYPKVFPEYQYLIATKEMDQTGYMNQTGDVRCGANGNVSLSFNVTPSYFIYKCGVYEGQFLKAQESSASVHRAHKGKLITLAFVCFLLQFLWGQ